MATCAVSYPADGRQQDFLVPFAYTRPDFIHVFIDEEPVAPAAIRWPSANTLRLVPAPPAGATVKIQRYSATKTSISICTNSCMSCRSPMT